MALSVANARATQRIMAQDLAAGILGNKNPCTNVLIDLAKWTGAPFGGPAPALATADRDHW